MTDSSMAGSDTGGASREEILSARFAQMVVQHVNLASMLLGKAPHPQTGETARDLEGAQMFIDQLEMLEAKTKGNLSRNEEALLKQSLMSLRLAFVEAVESPAAPPPAPAPAPASPAEPAGSAAQKSEPPPSASASDAESKKKFSKKY